MPPAPPLPAGTKVGEYEIVRQLERGGRGTVYEGRQPLIGKRVAIKLLDAGIAEDDAGFQRFIAEARAVNAIAHRGIVDVFAFGRHGDGQPYLVMELLEGRTFQRLIAERAPLAEAEVLRLGRECLEALAAAHRLGIVHREVSPSNLFLVEPAHGAPYVKVLDFGIAKAVTGGGLGVPATRDGELLGSPPYMSPEQVLGRPVSPPTDLYALGLVLYELLTGARAVEGPSLIETLRLQVEGPVPRPSVRSPAVSADLDALVVALLSKDPERRPASAELALERLRCVALACGQPWPEKPPAEAPRDLLPLAQAPEPWDARATPARLGGSASDAAAGVGEDGWPERSDSDGRATGQALSARRSRPSSSPPRPASAAGRHAWLGASGALLGGLVALAAVLWALLPQSPSEAPPAASAPPIPRRDAGASRSKSADAGTSPLAGSLLEGLRGRGEVTLKVETPQSGGRVSGIAAIEGWAVAPEGIQDVELIIDDVAFGAIPYGGSDLGIWGTYPLHVGVESPRFLMPFNFSELSPGVHRIALRARSREGRTTLVLVSVEVARLHDSYVEDPSRLRIEPSRLRLRDGRLELEGLRLDRLRYDLTLAYSVDTQDFVVERLEPRCTPAEFAAALRDPAHSPDAPLGYGFRRPLERAPALDGAATTVVFDRPPGGWGRRGNVIVTGWFAGAGEPPWWTLRVAQPGAEMVLPGTVTGRPWPDLARLLPSGQARALVGMLQSAIWGPQRYRLFARAGGPSSPAGAASTDVELVQFAGRWSGPLAFGPDAAARVGARPSLFQLSGVVAGGRRHDVELEFLPALQRFSITRIAPQPEVPGSAKRRTP